MRQAAAEHKKAPQSDAPTSNLVAAPGTRTAKADKARTEEQPWPKAHGRLPKRNSAL